jgi:restriction endonuclease BglII
MANDVGSLTFEKVKKYLPHFKSAIQVPIYVLGIDV